MNDLTAVDYWAILAASISAVALGLRSEMLKPNLSAFNNSPDIVHLALGLSAVALGGRVASIVGGSHALAAEAAVYTAQAFASAVLLWNLHRQRPDA